MIGLGFMVLYKFDINKFVIGKLLRQREGVGHYAQNEFLYQWSNEAIFLRVNKIEVTGKKQMTVENLYKRKLLGEKRG